MKNILVTICCALLPFTALHARIYKVATADEFNKAATQAVPGDEIVILNGTYTGWELTANTGGTAAKPIIIRAETSGKVIFTGDVSKPALLLTGTYTEVSGITFTACTVYKSKGGILIELKDTQHCRVTNCAFNKITAKDQFLPIVLVGGTAAYNRFDHCTFTGNIDNMDLQVKITRDAVPVYTLIDHNLFQEKAPVSWKVFNGGECVQVGQDPVLLGAKQAFTLVRDNRFVHCDGEAEVISNKSSGNRYINNYLENCKGELVMRGGHDCLIDSNTIRGGTGGIRVNGTHHTITNNVLEGLPTGIRLMYGMAKGKTDIGFYITASDCIIKNNKISSCATGILIGDSKNANWEGKFDTARYPSRTMQDMPPFDNAISNNTFTTCKTDVTHNEN